MICDDSSHVDSSGGVMPICLTNRNKRNNIKVELSQSKIIYIIQ